MILVRWAIPDMSSELRDQIRREAYITNEIIIKQEATRAKTEEQPTPNPSSPEPVFAGARMAQLIKGHLSSSQLDLVMHGPGDPTAPGHSNRRQRDNSSSNFIQSERAAARNRNTEMSSL